MNGSAPRTARLVVAWTRLYTAGLPTESSQRRRAELESDLWEQMNDPYEHHSRRTVLGRWLRGVPSDLWWRYRTIVDDRRARRTTHDGGGIQERSWWVVVTALLATAKIVLTLGATLFVNEGALVGPAIAAAFGALAGGLVLAGLIVRGRNLVTGSWLIVAGFVAGFDPILLPLGALLVIWGLWTADLQFSESGVDEIRLNVAIEQRATLTQRWYLWLAAAPVLFAIGLLFPLFVFTDTTESTDDYEGGISAVIGIVAWMTWWGLWLAAAACAGTGVVLGVLRGVVNHRTRPA